MTVGDHPAIVDELLTLCGAVVAVDRVQLLPLGEPISRELAERHRVMAAISSADVHRPGPVAVRGKRAKHVTLTIGDLRQRRTAGCTW